MARGLGFFTVCLAGLALFSSSAAHADDLVVTRNVTIRVAPARQSERVEFPAIGDRLELLDDGQQQSGYYHVRLPDGRTGWVYRTFVHREPSPPAPFVSGPASAPEALTGGSAMTVHYLDMDQGNAAIVEFPCAAVLIDSGGRDPVAAGRLKANLDAFFARRTDLGRRFAAVYVTHTHLDHNTTLGTLIYNYRVGAYIDNGRLVGSGDKDAVWMAAYARDATPKVERAIVLEKDVRAAGAQGLTSAVIDPVSCAGVDPRIRVLSGGRERSDNPGWSNDDFDNGNNHSIVIRIDYGEASFLFPGDLENAGITDLLSQYGASGLLDVDVLEVSHHGAENGTTPQLLAAVTPEVAVMSMGPESVQGQWTAFAYGHPRLKTVQLLRGAVSGSRAPKDVRVANAVRSFETLRMDRAVYGTGWDGTVTVTADAQGRISVKTER
ncbi:MAG: MBL fold metallo-hydrolase [Sphingomonas sp.]|uniref:MBL fold metallo-hydrolase n=1 Tax=Sphingomonas sp. TaxID=28214 RepID=UPI001205DBFF|nr:MBL fold metallo-hydrolase [Sphingomonas sp.]THD34446.1 MAG: MBL fold metallo-hydrolase [Sphingomonas sp.]